jgi:hypothetical protein
MHAQVFEEITNGADEVDLSGRKVSGRAYCSWYNFSGADQSKKVGVLSGECGADDDKHMMQIRLITMPVWAALLDSAARCTVDVDCNSSIPAPVVVNETYALLLAVLL